MIVRGNALRLNDMIEWLEKNVGPRLREGDHPMRMQGSGWVMSRNLSPLGPLQSHIDFDGRMFEYDLVINDERLRSAFALRWTNVPG